MKVILKKYKKINLKKKEKKKNITFFLWKILKKIFFCKNLIKKKVFDKKKIFDIKKFLVIKLFLTKNNFKLNQSIKIDQKILGLKKIN